MLKGAGRYVSDWNLLQQSYGQFLRSDRSHAEIVSIDAFAAVAMPGVVAVLTGEDIARAGQNPMPAAAPVKGRGAPISSCPRATRSRATACAMSVSRLR